MADAFKCDRCEEYSDSEPEVLKHPQTHRDPAYEKELCWTCYVGWIEYITGSEASEINGWENFRVDDEGDDE